MSARTASHRRAEARPRSSKSSARRRATRGQARSQGHARNQRRGAAGNVKRGAESRAKPRSEVRRAWRGPGPRARRALTRSLKLAAVVGAIYGAVFGAHEAYDYATTSPRFEVRSLIFEPTDNVDDDTMRQLLGLEHGTNILALEPEALAEQVAAHPWVAEALVLRHLPDTLEVRITERRAAAVALIDGFYLIDDEGRPFKRVVGDERGQLPVITGVSRNELLSDAAGARARLQRALDAIETYGEKQRPRLGEVHLEGEDAISLYTAENGIQLRFGRNEVRRGLARYDALRAALGARADQLAVVHLDAELRPGERERVVARFADTQTEHEILAEAALARADVDASAPEPEAGEPAVAAPHNAPRERRIPRY